MSSRREPHQIEAAHSARHDEVGEEEIDPGLARRMSKGNLSRLGLEHLIAETVELAVDGAA